MFAPLIDRLRAAPRNWLLLAAVVLILGQLGIIGMLAHGQLARAEQRNARQVSQRQAVLRCLGDGRPTRMDVCASAQDLPAPPAAF